MWAVSGAALKAEQKELLAAQKSETEMIRSLKDSMKSLQEQQGKKHSHLAAEYEAVLLEREINLLTYSHIPCLALGKDDQCPLLKSFVDHFVRGYVVTLNCYTSELLSDFIGSVIVPLH